MGPQLTRPKSRISSLRFRVSKSRIAILVVGALAGVAVAHDTWVQTNTNLVRVGDVVHVDLMLGNHGNDHRDFKLAGKPDLEKVTLAVIAPDGHTHDLKPTAVDLGLAPKEGYWTAKFRPSAPGMYVVAQASDAVVSYAPTRSIKSGKAMFVATKRLDAVPADNPGFDLALGHPLELVPKTNPVTPMGPGTTLKVQLLYKGKPLADHRVSFIPRGVTLAEGFDARYERKTDADGIASFEPPDANYYLVVAHHADDSAAGDRYTSTKYSAPLTVYVPAVCPCCGE
jgi:uncharacterized GH25 family protein